MLAPVDVTEEIRHHDALMRRVRLAAVVFAVVQLGVYRPPAGIERGFDPWIAIPVVCGALLGVSAVTWWLDRRASVRTLRACAVVQVGLDALIALGLVALFAFDPTSNVWALMIVPVLEGAVRHRLRGAVGAWLVQVPLFAAIAWGAAERYPQVDPRPSMATFVVGLVGLVAVTVGWLAAHLHERTEQYREAQARLSAMVYVDGLTRLPNRARLLGALDRLDAQEGAGYAVAFLDLDRFKEVNDAHGHEAGDELLCAIARRLEEAVRPTDLVARLAGDEFVVVLPGLRRRGEVVGALTRVAEAAEAMTLRSGEVVPVGVSVGAAVADGVDRPVGREVLRQADAAMYVAKRRSDGAPVVVEARDEVPASDVVPPVGSGHEGLAGVDE